MGRHQRPQRRIPVIILVPALLLGTWLLYEYVLRGLLF